MNIKTLLRTVGLAVLLGPALVTGAQAQQRQISGVVSDSQQQPLAGVTILVEGTTIGAITDAKGEYSVRVSEDSRLNFSCLGYTTQVIPVGTRTSLNVTMEEESLVMDDVVVTALGIKRSEKSLGYAVSKISNEDFTNTVSNNWLSGLAGKVAGLNFDQAAAGPSGSIRVTLRGESSLDPSKSEALFVVDGVPINSSMLGSGSSNAVSPTSTDMPIDYGNGASDLNPEDIENVTVLKGAAATALYGSRAANGAIIITTKSGKSQQKGIGVTVSSSVTLEQAGYWPDFQNEYGGGVVNSILQEQYYSFYAISAMGLTKSSTNNSWGPRFEGQMFYQYMGQQEDGTYVATPWVAQDWYKGFFRTGATYNNSVTVEGNNGKGSNARISFTDQRNNWISPNTGFTRQTFSFSGTTPLNRFITLNARVNYNNKKSDNLPMSGYGRSTIPYILGWSSPNVNVNWWRDYEYWVDFYSESNPARNNPFYNNGDGPYFQAYEQLNTMDRHRIYGTVDLMIEFDQHLSLMLRTGLDMSNELRTQRKPWGSHGFTYGRYAEQLITQNEFNNDFLLKYDRAFGDFGIVAMAGGNLMSQGYTRVNTTAISLESPGEYNFANSIDQLQITNTRNRKKTNSLYGMIQASFREFVFVDVTGRNDWSSTLQKGNNSYFYPSVSTSFLLSEVVNMSKKTDMFKLRVSWAKVGNDTNAYTIHNDYITSNFPGGVTVPTTYSSPDIKPEMVESWEYGIEGKFFKGRLGFDIAYYDATSRNQILSVPVDPAAGYYSVLLNAGKITNKGWEVGLNGQPVRTTDFRWNASVVYSRNKNRVVELAEGLDTWVITSSNGASIEARPGGTLGDIYGFGFERAPEDAYVTLEDGSTKSIAGEVMYDPATGYPIQNTSETIYLGNIQSKWKGGITNSFSYKGIKVNIQVDGQFGGKAYSMTHSQLAGKGKLRSTLEGRYDGLVGDGYYYDATAGTYHKNTTVTENIGRYYEYTYNSNNHQNNIFSTSFIKLREVRVEYSLPSKLLNKTGFLRGASIAVFGRNLAMWTKWPLYDPEVASLHGSNIGAGMEIGSFPMTRSYGVNIKLKF